MDQPDDPDGDADQPAVPEMPFNPQVRTGVRAPVDEAFRQKNPLFLPPGAMEDVDEPDPLPEPNVTRRNAARASPVEAPVDGSPPPEPDEQAAGDSSLPAWRRIQLPAIPLPDDAKIDADIHARFAFPVLLQQVRSTPPV
jgi:hypothetical protein